MNKIDSIRKAFQIKFNALVKSSIQLVFPGGIKEPSFDENGRIPNTGNLARLEFCSKEKIPMRPGGYVKNYIDGRIFISGIQGNSEYSFSFMYEHGRDYGGMMNKRVASILGIPGRFLWLHGRSLDGVPFHAFENGAYWLKRLDPTWRSDKYDGISPGQVKGIVEDHYGASLERIDGILGYTAYLQPFQASMDLCLVLYPEWKEKAQECINWMNEEMKK